MTPVQLPGPEGRTVFRRDHRKRDGRMLHLYGYAPHTGEPLPEDDIDVAEGGELRFHPLRREWNVYAPHRQSRTFKPSSADDPLSPSRPGGAPTEIPFADFEMAVFENRFTSLHRNAPAPPDVPGVDTARARGHCDVIVYGPEATGDLHGIGQDRRRLLLAAWNDRYAAHFAQGLDFVYPFENRGDAIGVTLHHPHGQIYAFPFVPQVQATAARAFADGYRLSEHLQGMADDHGVAEAGGVRATCPPFARFPYETYLTSDRPVRGPWEFTDTEADGFAYLLGEMTRRYDTLFGEPTPYMLSLHAAPRTAEAWEFSARFYPLMRSPGRIKYLAGVEQGTGVFTVDVMPRAAAAALRAV